MFIKIHQSIFENKINDSMSSCYWEQKGAVRIKIWRIKNYSRKGVLASASGWRNFQRSISWRETSIRHLTVIFFKLWMSAIWQNYCNSKACITRLQYVFLVSLSFEARRKWSIKVSIRFPDQKKHKNCEILSNLQLHRLVYSCHRFWHSFLFLCKKI